MDLAELRAIALFDGLTTPSSRALAAAGEQVAFDAGRDALHEGRPADSWWVLLEGAVDLVRQVGSEETVLGTMDEPGQWAGGFRAWDEYGVYFATGRAAAAGGCSGVPAEGCGGWPSVVPVRGALHRGPGPDRAHASSRPPGSARRWWRWARWRPGWRTR